MKPGLVYHTMNKGEGRLLTHCDWQGEGEVKVQLYSCLISLLYEGGWGGACQRHASTLYARERAPVPLVEEVGWASGPDWTDMEKRRISCRHWASNPEFSSP